LQLPLTVAVLLLSMPAFAAEPKLVDFPLRGEVSTASRTRSDGNTWTTFKIDRSSYVVTGGDFGVGIYAVRIKGMTLEVLTKGDNGKLHVSKCPITVIVNLKTGEVVHLSSDALRVRYSLLIAMRKSELRHALRTEIQKRNLSTFMSDRHKIVQTGCSTCQKHFGTVEQIAMLARLKSSAPSKFETSYFSFES
jgi:hypothetical protein